MVFPMRLQLCRVGKISLIHIEERVLKRELVMFHKTKMTQELDWRASTALKRTQYLSYPVLESSLHKYKGIYNRLALIMCSLLDMDLAYMAFFCFMK